MPTIQVLVTPDQMKTINDLKTRLLEAAALHGSLAADGFQLMYNIGPDPRGQFGLTMFEVKAPLDMSKLTQG